MPLLPLNRLLPLYGGWSAINEQSVTLKCKAKPGEASHGLALISGNLDDGSIECKVRVPKWTTESGAMIVFRANGQENYYAAGLGGWDNAYTIMEGNHLRFTRLVGAGSAQNIVSDRDYTLKLTLEGQKVDLFVDNIKVASHRSLTLTGGLSIGLFAFKGTEEVTFSELKTDGRKPKTFVVMQFSEPYNEVYRDAIQPLVGEMGFEPVRGDDMMGPGIIINDVINQISEASVILAEVSEANPNVYYEVGMAHALAKPTILLAQRGTKLPFDVGPHRCIFYDNTIAGRTRLQESLRRSLETLLGISTVEEA